MTIALMLTAVVSVCFRAADPLACLESEYKSVDIVLNSQWQKAIVAAKAAERWDIGRYSALSPDLRKWATKPIHYELDLRRAQRRWLEFRNAECNSRGNGALGGTDQHLIYENCLVDLTRTRTKQLGHFVVSLEDGH